MLFVLKNSMLFINIPGFPKMKDPIQTLSKLFFFNQHDARVNLCKKLDIFFILALTIDLTIN